MLCSAFASTADAQCFRSSGSESCWRAVELLGGLGVATISKNTAVDILKTAEEYGFTSGLNETPGTFFLRQFLASNRLDGRRAFSIVPGDLNNCFIFEGEFPEYGRGETPDNCLELVRSLTTLITVHYICEEPALTRGLTDADRECPYRAPSRLPSNWHRLFYELGILTAAMLEDDSLLQSFPWSAVFEGREGEAAEAYQIAVEKPVDVRFTNYRNMIREAQAAAFSEILESPSPDKFRSVEFVVGNSHSTRTVEAGKVFGQVAFKETGNDWVSWEPENKLPFDFVESVCSREQGDTVVALVDASAYYALTEANCNLLAVPAARLGSEKFYIAVGEELVDSSFFPPWLLSANVGIADGTPDGAASADQMLIDLARMEFSPSFGTAWNEIVHKTGGLATEALASGDVQITVSNTFEVLSNVSSEQVILAGMTSDNESAFRVASLEDEGYEVTNHPTLNYANNYFLAVFGEDSADTAAYVADVAKIVTASEEWQKFLKENSMIDVDPLVLGDELESLGSFFRP